MASSIGEDFSLSSGRDQSQVHADMGEIRSVINEIASAMRKVRVHYLCYQRDVVYGVGVFLCAAEKIHKGSWDSNYRDIRGRFHWPGQCSDHHQ